MMSPVAENELFLRQENVALHTDPDAQPHLDGATIRIEAAVEEQSIKNKEMNRNAGWEFVHISGALGDILNGLEF
jgi:hypothetical protein